MTARVNRLSPAVRRRVAVVVGSVIGTGLRAGLGELAGPPGGWPWATLLANVTGAVVLGYLLTRLQRAARPTTLTIPLLCTGVLGSYTTFSAFAVETRALLAAGQPGTAAAYAGVSLVAGYLAALAGVRAAEARA